MLEILGSVCEEIEDMKDVADIVYTASDLDRIQKEGKLAVVLGMEGLSALRGNVSLITLRIS